MLTIPKSSVSRDRRASANSTVDCPDWRPGRSASVTLRLDAGIEGLRELERRVPEELAALPLVRVVDRHPEVVAEAISDVAGRWRPGGRDGAAVEAVAVVRAGVDGQLSVGLLDQPVDVDLRDGAQGGDSGTVLDRLDRTCRALWALLGVGVGCVAQLRVPRRGLGGGVATAAD